VLNSTQAMEAVCARGRWFMGRHALIIYRGRIRTLRNRFSLAWKWCVDDGQSLEEGYAADLKLVQVTHQFTRTIYSLSPGIFTTLLQTTIGALAVQERYALVSACSFLVGPSHASTAYPYR
jgi:hypothetical protein